MLLSEGRVRALALMVAGIAIGAGVCRADAADVFERTEAPASELLQMPLEDGQAILWHLFHSGFAVRTSDHLMIFDYWPVVSSASQRGGLAAGFIDPVEIQDQNVIVFISHEHHDHWYRGSIDWEDKVKKIHYVVSPEVADSDERFESRRGVVTVTPPDAVTKIGDLRVTTVQSTDSGVAFLVETGDLTIYHSGDHASWNWKNDPDAEEEFVNDLLKPIKDARIDIAMHVADPRLSASGWSGAVSFARKFRPALLVPMHARGKYETYNRLAATLASQAPLAVWRTRARGDSILFSPHLASEAPAP